LKPRQRKDTGKWEVRFLEGGRYRSRSFDRKGDAQDWIDAEKRRRQLGWVPSSTAGRITLAEFMEEWWRVYAVPNLAPKTREVYGQIWERHIRRRLGGYQVREISPATIEDFRAHLHAAGVGDPNIIKAMGLLQGILKRAVVRGHLSLNPVVAVDKPKQRRTRRSDPLSPATVEAIRAHLRPYDATLVSVMAYAGLRPKEAMQLRWQDVGPRGLRVYAPKTDTHRIVTLLAPLAADLLEWRMANGRPDPRELIFPRSGDRPWRDHHWRNWRKRMYQGTKEDPGAARKAGVTGDLRPYRLRGSFVSLLLWEGKSIGYVAEQAGHDVATLSSHYAGVLHDLEGSPRISAEEAIRQARSDAGLRSDYARSAGDHGA
jgi:integrase